MPDTDWLMPMMAAFAPATSRDNPAHFAREPVVVQLYGQLHSIQQKMAKDLMDHDDKIRLAHMKMAVAQGNNLTELRTTLMHERAASSRTTAQTRGRFYDTTVDAATSMAKMKDDHDPAYLHELEAVARKAVSDGKYKDLNSAMIHTAAVHQFAGNNPFDSSARNASGTVFRALSELGVDLDAPDWQDQVRNTMGESNFTNEAIRKLAPHHVKRRNLSMGEEAATELLSDGKILDDMDRKLAAGGGDTPELRAQRAEVEKRYLARADAFSQMHGKVFGGDEGIIADIEKFQQEGANRMARYDEVMAALAEEIIGPASAGPERGKLVGSEKFQRWAKSNGYDVENLGYISEDGRYVEGGSDTDAIALYNWQKKHPNKLRPGVRRGQSTGRVAIIEQDYPPEELAKFARGNGGQFMVKHTEKGFVPLRRDNELLKMSKDGGYVFERDGKTFVAKMPADFAEYDRVDRELAAYIDSFGGEISDADKAEIDALIKTMEEDYPEHKAYSAFTEYQKAKTTEDSADDAIARDAFLETVGTMEVSEVRKDGSVRRVPPSEAKGLYYVPTKDGEAFDDAIFEAESVKHGADFLDVVAPQISSVKALDPREVYVDMEVIHADDIRDGKLTVKGTTAAGDVEFEEGPDQTWKIAEESAVKRGFRFVRGLDPEERFLAAKAEAMGEPFEREKPVDRGGSEGKKALKEEEKAKKAEESIHEKVGKDVAEKPVATDTTLTPKADREAKKDRYEEIGAAYLEDHGVEMSREGLTAPTPTTPRLATPRQAKVIPSRYDAPGTIETKTPGPKAPQKFEISGSLGPDSDAIVSGKSAGAISDSRLGLLTAEYAGAPSNSFNPFNKKTTLKDLEKINPSEFDFDLYGDYN